MDGASKFVRGDAIAGIIITAINIIVGLILGVVSYDMSFSQAAEIFTLMTVGDGLVSQIPALVISTAAGIIVTRTGEKDSGLSESLGNQVLNYPRAIQVCAGLLVIMSIIPGMPFLPFLLLGVGLFFVSRYAKKAEEERIQAQAASSQLDGEGGEAEEDIERPSSYRYHCY